MKILLRREKFSERSTIGALFVDGQFECYTWEPVVTGGSLFAGGSAIPYGVFPVIMSRSEHLKKDVPMLQTTPNAEAVLIHPGGAEFGALTGIVVGTATTADSISNSRLAFDRLLSKIVMALQGGTVEMTIVDGRITLAKDRK